jgi:hypothetical protein
LPISTNLLATFPSVLSGSPESVNMGFAGAKEIQKVRPESFANDEAKSAEWTAFMRRSRLTAAPARFTEVVSVVRNFAYPLLSAAASGAAFNRTWQPGGPWTVEDPK